MPIITLCDVLDATLYNCANRMKQSPSPCNRGRNIKQFWGMICQEIEWRDHAAALHWQKSLDEKELKPRFLQQDLQQSGNAGDIGPHTDRHPLFQMRPLRGVPDYRSDDQFNREGSSYSRCKSIVSACITTDVYAILGHREGGQRGAQ